MKITTKPASSSRVTFVTQRRFTRVFLFFLPSCFVKSLISVVKKTGFIQSWAEKFLFLHLKRLLEGRDNCLIQGTLWVYQHWRHRRLNKVRMCIGVSNSLTSHCRASHQLPSTRGLTKLTRAKALQDTKNEVSEFNIRYLFLANREPNICTCAETALQMHRRYKDIYPLIDKKEN